MEPNKVTINITLPKSWAELSNEQLYYVFDLICDSLSGSQIRAYCFFRWSGLGVVCRYGDGYILRKNRLECYVTGDIVAGAMRSLMYLESMPERPVRIGKIRKHYAYEAELDDVPFEKYLYVENLYQGYLRTQNHQLLQEMGQILYDCEGVHFNQAEKLNVFYWWTSLKNYFSQLFPNFFVPAGAPSDGNLLGNPKPIGQQLREAMNAQIRALTKGDITKEKEVLALPTPRALTELDALAKEAEEIRRKYGNRSK